MFSFQALNIDSLIGSNWLPMLDACLLMLLASTPTYFWVVKPIALKLSQNKQQLRSLIKALDGASNSVMITNTQGHIQYVNQALCAITGYSKKELIGKNPSILQSGKQDAAFYQSMWNSILHTGKWQGELWNKRKNGALYLEELHIKSIQDEHGVTQSYIGSISDITLKKQQEELQLKTQKMASIGTLVGGIAHNFNNLLAAMIGQLYLAKNSQSLDQAKAFMDDIERSSFQAADIIKQLLVFSRSQHPEKINTDIIALIQTATKTASLGIPENIQFKTHFTDQKMTAFCDPSEIQQLIIHIINNARDAVENSESKELSLTVDTQSWKDCNKNNSCQVCQSHVAHITIKDSGAGISPDHLEHIFDPFFTTKEPGQGTGLGLSTCYATVQAHQGHISVDSQLGHGSTFEICLPISLHEQPQVTELKSIVKASYPANILLVDDDDMVRHTLSQLLHSLGYQTIIATNGQQAIDLALNHEPAPDMLLTDIVMPVMDGISSAQAILKEKPTLPILFISGYDQSQQASHLITQENCLEKPFNIVTLSHKIQQILHSNT
ncbi:MAG: ATP-binding protein [Mariprofundaceae bacterium]